MSTDRVTLVPRPKATSADSIIPGSRSWRWRVLLAPGRVSFLGVLALLELCGLPKIKLGPSSGRDRDESGERAR